MAGQQIGYVARQLGVPVETIRYYERSGLVDQPVRTAGNYRLYGDAQIEQLTFILNCRSLDMTHEEIRRLLHLRKKPPNDCTEVNALIDEHIDHIETRIAELQSLSKKLRGLRKSCNEVRSLEDCTILGSLRRTPTSKSQAKAKVDAHQATHSPRAKRR